MNDREFIINLLILLSVFIVFMTALVMIFIIVMKRIKSDKCYEVIQDLETTINNMSRDATVNKQYTYRLGQCLRILKDYIE